MKFKQLIEPVPRKITPQCAWPQLGQKASPRLEDAVLKYGFDPEQCLRFSSIELDGKPYCRSHAGKMALQFVQNIKG